MSYFKSIQEIGQYITPYQIKITDKDLKDKGVRELTSSEYSFLEKMLTNRDGHDISSIIATEIMTNIDLDDAKYFCKVLLSIATPQLSLSTLMDTKKLGTKAVRNTIINNVDMSLSHECTETAINMGIGWVNGKIQQNIASRQKNLQQKLHLEETLRKKGFKSVHDGDTSAPLQFRLESKDLSFDTHVKGEDFLADFILEIRTNGILVEKIPGWLRYGTTGGGSQNDRGSTSHACSNRDQRFVYIFDGVEALSNYRRTFETHSDNVLIGTMQILEHHMDITGFKYCDIEMNKADKSAQYYGEPTNCECEDFWETHSFNKKQKETL